MDREAEKQTSRSGGITKGTTKGTGSDFTRQKSMLRSVARVVTFTIAIGMLLGYFSTCFRQVKVQETGILLRFGRVIQQRVDPGICIKLPWPIDRLITVKTQTIETRQAGFGISPEKEAELERTHGPLTQLVNGTLIVPYVITGDKNVLHLRVLVNYQISDPVTYSFFIDDADKMLGQLTQHTILAYVSSAHVDDLLTSGKIELRDYVYSNLNDRLKSVKLGVEVVSVNIRNVRPPGPTSQAFRDVINAQEESRELVHQAESYMKRVVPEAHAESQQVMSLAEAYRTQTIEGAKGESQRFTLLAAEYSEFPDVTRERLRRETLDEIFPLVSKYLIGNSNDKNATSLRFIVPSE